MIKLNFSKFILLSSSILLCSCSATKVISAEKFIIYPGVPSGTPFISYEVSLNADKNFSIKYIKLSDTDSITGYAVQNLNTSMYLNPKVSVIPEGSYKITFKTFDISKINNSEFIKIEIEMNHQIKILKSDIDLKKEFHSR